MSKTRRLLAALVALAISIPTAAVITPATATAAVGQGFSITASDLSYILKQIKIAENHVANTTPATGACGALLGSGPNQLASPLLSFGLRTVDGSCNNLVPGQEHNGAADQVFPRLTTPVFAAVPPENNAPLFGPATPSSYAQKSGNVIDTQPRVVSNLIVDQTANNPAAVAAAGFPVRTQGNPRVQVCTTDASTQLARFAGGTDVPARWAAPRWARDAVHPERDDRRRPLAAVQQRCSRSSASSSTTASIRPSRAVARCSCRSEE